MSRRPARFTQADIRRAIRAAETAGLTMAVEILSDGTIRLTQFANPTEKETIAQKRKIVL